MILPKGCWIKAPRARTARTRETLQFYTDEEARVTTEIQALEAQIVDVQEPEQRRFAQHQR